MTTEHDYEKALNLVTRWFDSINYEGPKEGHKFMDGEQVMYDAGETIRHALRVAKKLAEEPSGGMLGHGSRQILNAFNLKSQKMGVTSGNIFKAMREQLYKELENGKTDS